ncbi:hypothetical protein Goari_008747, partial [Gossypium aridum]|nr:hypothetical protein [Gossypium aridum]
DVETIKELIEKGSATRSTGTSGANEESSHSHAILKLAIKRSVDGTESKRPRLMQILVYRSGWKWKSLLALKECIRALDNDQGHIPFRGSKLTESQRLTILMASDFKHSKSDDDLNTLLQEEEDLVNAHRKQVETMNIVKEEVNLLVEADRPGKQQDGYISRLNAIFSQKADNVVQ